MSWRGDKLGPMSSEEMNAFLAGPWLARHQFVTVGLDTSSFLAIALLDSPSAAIMTIFARRASACGRLRDLA